MKIEWDFKELNDFSTNLKNSSEFDVNMVSATKKIARVLHKYLLINTPVDTGLLKQMWNAGDNLKFTVFPDANGFHVTLYNTASNNKSPKYPNFQYGLAVNDGHNLPNGSGWCVGRFFVEKSILQTTQQVEQIIMKELQKWWDSL